MSRNRYKLNKWEDAPDVTVRYRCPKTERRAVVKNPYLSIYLTHDDFDNIVTADVDDCSQCGSRHEVTIKD